ncbi:zona pellucida sperm-binding protein 3-like [Eucyclogobius newberryi]|uniref:zona pellucida sperm-binding protein 3-like n=1 Tax=Eucyclogobius newberryi TaxID=166745 RepID=UPI003B58CBF5
MAFFCQFAVFVAFGTLVSVKADMKLDCQPDSVSLVWTETRPQVDTSLYRLGNCLPTSVTATQAVFRVALDECKFRRMVTGDSMLYSNNLTYVPSPESQFVPFDQSVTCVYERPKNWYPMIYNPVFSTYGEGELVFHFEVMNSDFTGPAESATFPLGALIPFRASVQQASHQPLQLFVEECVASTSPQLLPNHEKYTIITNKGCLVDSKVSRSRFLPRQKSSEINGLLQAFKFSTGEQVYLHCTLVAWDPTVLGTTKKACNYVQGHGWELADNPSYSNLCDCCESSCNARRTRSTRLGDREMVHEALLGPITITDRV